MFKVELLRYKGGHKSSFFYCVNGLSPWVLRKLSECITLPHGMAGKGDILMDNAK